MRCRKEDKECVIGSSNRGGRRVRRSTTAQKSLEIDSARYLYEVGVTNLPPELTLILQIAQ